MQTDTSSDASRPAQGPARLQAPVLVFYIALLLLNAGELRESIARQPYGPARSFWLGVVDPCADLAARLRLERLRMLVRSTAGSRLNDNS